MQRHWRGQYSVERQGAESQQPRSGIVLTYITLRAWKKSGTVFISSRTLPGSPGAQSTGLYMGAAASTKRRVNVFWK